MRRAIRLGLIAALFVATGLALLWVTGAIERDELFTLALRALGVVAILAVAGIAYSALRGRVDAPDSTDQPVP